MSVRKRHVRFLGLMAVLVLASVSAMSCRCPCSMEHGFCQREYSGVHPSGTFNGMAWDDVDGDKVKDPAEAVLTGMSIFFDGFYGAPDVGPFSREANGTYSRTVPTGYYKVKCTATGFVDQTTSMLQLTANETETHDFGMRH